MNKTTAFMLPLICVCVLGILLVLSKGPYTKETVFSEIIEKDVQPYYDTALKLKQNHYYFILNVDNVKEQCEVDGHSYDKYTEGDSILVDLTRDKNKNIVSVKLSGYQD